MPVSSQFVVLSFLNFVTGFLLCVSGAIGILSTGTIKFLGDVRIPVKTTFAVGAITGLMHALVYGSLIFYRAPVSLPENAVLTFIAAMAVVFLMLVRFGVVYFIKNDIVPSLANLFQALYIGLIMFSFISAILLIPSLVAGVVNKIVSDLVL